MVLLDPEIHDLHLITPFSASKPGADGHRRRTDARTWILMSLPHNTVGSHLSQTPLKSDAGARFLRADFHLSQTHPLKSDTLGGSEKK